MVSDCCFKRCYERGLMIACWFVVAVWGCLPRRRLLRGWILLAWVWVLFGIGDGWPGVGSCGVARGVGMAGCVQRSSGLLAARGASNLCRGSPYLDVSGGGVLGNLEFPWHLGDCGVSHSWLAYRMGCGYDDCPLLASLVTRRWRQPR